MHWDQVDQLSGTVGSERIFGILRHCVVASHENGPLLGSRQDKKNLYMISVMLLLVLDIYIEMSGYIYVYINIDSYIYVYINGYNYIEIYVYI